VAGWDWPSIAAFAALASALAVVGLWFLRSRPSASEVERRRRLHVHRSGRLTDATILEMEGETVFYSYTVAGVTYSAAQDLSSLARLESEDGGTLLGHSYCKYQLNNPANSIVICEEWSGLERKEIPKP
jgi:hypothetical protein